MKILFLMSSAGLSGAEICLLRLAKGIEQSEQNSVIVLNSEEGILNDKFRDSGINVYVQKSIHVKKIYRITEIGKLIKNIFAFKRLIRIERPDIIHAFTLPLSRRIILFKKIGINIPVVGTTHDAMEIQLFGKRKLDMFTRSINENYVKLICVSNATKLVAIESGVIEKKIEVIYNGIPDNKVTHPIKNTDEYIIGNFGRILFGKGQHVTIDAVNLLKKVIPNLKCLIIGGPALGISGSLSYYEALKEKVVKNELENEIEFIDWVDGLDEYYNRLNVYVLSSVNQDSFPTVNLEAMQHRIPVIATSIGGSKEQIIDGVTGFIIEPGNAGKLAEKILFLYNNRDVAFRMGELGYKRVSEEFTIQKYVDQHLKLYQECLQRK